MSVDRDFDIIVPKDAVRIIASELMPLFKDYLSAVGINNPSSYDHYQIRILIRPRKNAPPEDNLPLFELFKPKSRKDKRRSFASADSLFIAMEVAHDGITFREAYPPTTYEDGQTEFMFAGTAGVGAGIDVHGVKAMADLQASIKRQFKKKKLAIVAQKTNGIAIWDFRRPWIVKNNQPELHITCSVSKDLPKEQRYVLCRSRVTQDKREIFAPRKAKKILLPQADQAPNSGP